MDSIGDLHKSFVYAQIHALRIRIALDGAAVRTALCAAPQAELPGSSMRVSVEPRTALQDEVSRGDRGATRSCWVMEGGQKDKLHKKEQIFSWNRLRYDYVVGKFDVSNTALRVTHFSENCLFCRAF